MRKTFSEIIMCTDASLTGGGVVYTRATPGVARRVGDMNLLDRQNWIKSVNWVTAFRHKWKEKEGIHLLKGEALVLGLC